MKSTRKLHLDPDKMWGALFKNMGHTWTEGVVGSILHGGPIELFLVPASAPRLVLQRLWYVLSCLWDDAYKRTLAANQKE